MTGGCGLAFAFSSPEGAGAGLGVSMGFAAAGSRAVTGSLAKITGSGDFLETSRTGAGAGDSGSALG